MACVLISGNRKAKNNLIIRRMEIKSFGKIKYLTAQFDPHFTVLSSNYTQEILYAVWIILNKKLQGEPPEKIPVRDNTSIKAEIEVDGTTYFVCATPNISKNEFEYQISVDETQRSQINFYSLIHQTPEEEMLSCFQFKKNLYSQCLKKYLDIENNKRELICKTEGVSITKTFRVCLKKFIENYMPQKMPGETDLYIILKDSGDFMVENENEPGKQVQLMKTQQMIFECVCYLTVNHFWKQIEAIRDMHHPTWPLIFMNMEELTDHFSEFSKLIGDQHRQMILNVEAKKHKRILNRKEY